MRHLLSRGSIQTKLVAGFLTMAAILVATGLYGLARQESLHQRLTSVSQRDLVPLADLRVVQKQGDTVTILGFVLGAATDPAVVERMSDSRTASSRAMDVALAALQRDTPADLRARSAEIVTAWKADAAADAAYQAGAHGPDALALNKAASGAYDRLHTLIDDQADHLMADSRHQVAVVDAEYRTTRIVTLAILVLGGAFALAVGLLLAHNLRTRIAQMLDAVRALAAGDLTHELSIAGTDELARMGGALGEASESLRTAFRGVATNAEALHGRSEQLGGVARTLAATAQETAESSGGVSAAAAQVSYDVQAVATGSDEMGEAIREIAQSASAASVVGAEATDIVRSTTERIMRLGDSSREIGSVVKAITSIAEQTNLLALNATIEAARAGESGKGFAVVAGEVKDLAQETARATEDISRRVEAIQADTTGAIAAITEISVVIGRLGDHQNTIASAVEEQTASTQEASRSIAAAASGVDQIAASISGVAQAARSTGSGVDEARRTAEELAQMSGDLTALVGRFRF